MNPIRFFAFAAAAALAATLGVARAEGTETEEHPILVSLGDDLQIGLPVAGLALTWLLDDPRAAAPGFLPGDWYRLGGSPRHDLAVALFRTELVTYSLKYSVNETRPNGGRQSFPSGHTAGAFLGAEFIRKEYGLGWGAPAYALAGYVGWTRVNSGAHWKHDVVAGGLIGILSNHDLISFGSAPRGGALSASLLSPDDGPPAPGVLLGARF